MNSPSLNAVKNLTDLTAAAKKKSSKSVSMLNYRLMIFYRFALASVGGYLLASLSAACIAQYFAQQRASAAMSATLIAFCLQAAAFIWVFMVNKTLKASLGIILPCLIIFAFIQMAGH